MINRPKVLVGISMHKDAEDRVDMSLWPYYKRLIMNQSAVREDCSQRCLRLERKNGRLLVWQR